MPEIVEQSCHLLVGADPARWTIHDDGSWKASYGNAQKTGEAEHPEAARVAARGWLNVLHEAHTGETLPE